MPAAGPPIRKKISRRAAVYTISMKLTSSRKLNDPDSAVLDPMYSISAAAMTASTITALGSAFRA